MSVQTTRTFAVNQGCASTTMAPTHADAVMVTQKNLTALVKMWMNVQQDLYSTHAESLKFASMFLLVSTVHAELGTSEMATCVKT